MNVFFLFAGTRPRRKCIAQGTFRCPACGRSTTYERCLSARWLHLYWIPLVKVGQEAEVCVCGSCGAAMDASAVGASAMDGGRLDAGGRTAAGEARTTWPCARCGNINPDAAVTCLKCGAKG